jgi:hypothetical protein
MRRLGWRSQFIERPWAEIRELESRVRWEDNSGRYLVDIIDSVDASGVAAELAGTTSMHDLVVVNRPVPEPPMDVLVVRAPTSLTRPSNGCVLIEYLAVSGNNTSIERPAADAVSLFWRFVAEKFGIATRLRR